jgi:hypothetical protein
MHSARTFAQNLANIKNGANLRCCSLGRATAAKRCDGVTGAFCSKAWRSKVIDLQAELN